jgi:hypothetical protein
MKTITIKIRYQYLAIVACLILAAFFIFNHIGARAFWGDEADVANLISTNTFHSLLKNAILDGHPVLYAYLIKSWAFFFGLSEIALRSFSAFFALLIILILYPIGKSIFKSSKSGLLASFIAATNFFLIWWSTQNKAYTLAALAGLVSFWFFTKLIFDSKRIYKISYILTTSFSAYLHPWLILVFGSQILSLLIFRKETKNLRQTILSQAIILLLTIPALLIYFYQGRLGSSLWIGKPPLTAPFQSIAYLSFGSLWAYLIIFFVALGFLAYHWEKRKKPRNPIFWILILYLIIPPIFAAIVSQFKPMYEIGRYEIIVLPAFILLLAGLSAKITDRTILTALTILLCGTAFYNVAQDRQNSNFKTTDKTLVQKIINESANGDFIITTGLSQPTFFYYLNRLNKNSQKNLQLISFPAEMNQHPGWINSKKIENEKNLYKQEGHDLIEKIAKEKNSQNKIWVMGKPEEEISGKILSGELAQKFSLTRSINPEQPQEPSWISKVLIFQ